MEAIRAYTLVRIEQRTIKLDQLTVLCRPDFKDEKLNTHAELQQLSKSDDPEDMMSNATPEQRTELLKIMLHRPALSQDEERVAIVAPSSMGASCYI